MPVDVDFARLRPWGRGQDTAFEELCCQIARAQAAGRGHRFVRLGTPDGGVEAYEIDGNGGEHGVQAKFFLGRPTTNQWTEITSSIRRAISTHARLVELTIALPVDRADPRIDDQTWFMDEWDAKKTEWETYAQENGRDIIFSYMGKSEIVYELSQEEHAGRYSWWFDRQLLSDSWLNARLEEAISQVGPRYNRDLTVGVPAGRALVQFSRPPALLAELDRLAITASEHAATIAAALSSGRQAEILEATAGLPRPVSGTDPVPSANVTPPFADWLEAWKSVGRAAPRHGEVPLEDAHSNPTGAEQAIDGLSDAGERATSLLYEDARAYQAPAMLLWGDAGAGKTHLLCDTAVQALNRGEPAIVILGQQLGPGQPWNEILRLLQFQGGADEFLQALSARAEAAGQRALLLIDAINENNGPALWPNHLASFLTLARRYPWIGVVLSVRTTAIPLLIPRHILEADSPHDPLDLVIQDTIRDPVLLQVRHTGFASNSVEALIAFFDYYGLPLPAAPLVLYQELANPLLLRLYCQAATHELGLLARPLPGLTRIVEAVLRDIDSRARVTLLTDPYREIAKPASLALALAMLRDGRTYLTRQAAADAADAAVPVPAADGYARTPLAVLISEGMLAEDFIAGEPGQYLPVVRFAFERIGDHLGAQALLDGLGYRAGVPSDEGLAGLAVSLLPADASAPGAAGAYRLQSMLEALAVLLPERLSRELPDLVTTLQHQPGWQLDIGTSAHQAWLSSLPVRAASAFTDATRQLLAVLVTGAPDVAAYPPSDIRRMAIRTALALSVHPDQPLGPGWLHDLLAPMSMPERDRRWTAQVRGTERIRGSDHVATVYSTLFFWCRTATTELLMTQAFDGKTFAQLAALALMWALPSPDRFLRDSATRAIVALADADPAVITSLLGACAGVDDDYLTERVLGAACACVLRRGRQPPTLASDLRRFLDGHGLPAHVLARDYLVVAVNALAAHDGEDEDLAALSAMVLPPYPAAWPGSSSLPDMSDLIREHPPFDPDVDLNEPPSDPGERERRRRAAVSGGYVSITSSLANMGDFYRYVMHGNNPDGFPFAQQRLDEPLNGEPLEPLDPAVLPGWILARVLQLGWSPQEFGAVDFDIEQEYSQSDAHKRERFGKKYQWLAWHEALACLSGTQRFRDPTDPDANRPYESAWQLDFVRDIDPTHLLDEPAPGAPQHWRALWLTTPLTLDATVAATPGQDGPAAPPIVIEPGQAGNWWFPVPHLSQPPRLAGQDPVHALSDWATSSADLPDLADYLTVDVDLEQWVRNGRAGQPAAGGRRYRLLTAHESLLEDPGGYPRADILVNIDSVLIRRQDLAALEQWPGTVPIYGIRLDVSITDAIFLGEWPAAAAYLAMCDPAFRPRTWQDAQGTDAIGLGFPAAVMAEDYVWEGSLLDCSIPATLSVHLLTAAAAALFPGVRQLDGVARTVNGDLLHIDPAPAPGGDSALLIDEAFLAGALAQDDLALVQIIRQSKRVLTGDADNRFSGDIITARFVATVGEETLCDTSRQWIHEARLDK